MTAYQFLPPLSDAEYEALRADIAANGMRHPILVDEKGKILDGHHRARIAAELGFKPEREVAEGLTEEEKRDVAFTLNSARRHMDGTSKRAAVIASLKADPQLSDRQHARRTGVSHPTVAGIRAELVAAGRVESFTTRIDSGGREQPVARASSPSGPDAPSVSATDQDRTGQQPPRATGEAHAGLDRVGVGSTDASEAPPSVPLVALDGAGESPVVSVGEAGTTGDIPDPLEDREALEQQHRERSSEAVAEALVAIRMRLEPDPVRWLNETWIPGSYRFRDMPRVRDSFTADGLRTSAKYLEMLADHLDQNGEVL